MKKYIVHVHEDRTVWRNEQGQYHREEGPAFERTDGYKAYYINDLLHNENGPAIERPDKSKEYWINGVQFTEEEFLSRTQTKELTIADIEQLLGYPVKIVK